MASGSSLRLPAKCAVIAAVMSFLVPFSAWARSSTLTPSGSTCIPGVAICIDNQGGTAMGSASGGLFMTGSGGSIASTVMQIGGVQGSNLGTLTLTTGALLTGTLAGGGTFAPGTLTITTSGWNGFSGTLFSGSFGNASSPIQWLFIGKVGSFFEYELIGPVSGMWEGGATVGGQTAQLFFNSRTKYNGGAITLGSGTTGIVVPEPGTVGLMGTGLLGMGLLVRRKVKTGQNRS
jgi:hypothetical protein